MPIPQILLHPQGCRCSRLAMGVWRMAAWQMSPSELRSFVQHCLDLGITTFDHADIYGNYTCEALFGTLLQAEPSLRDRLQIITKCGIKLISPNRPEHSIKHYDSSRNHILASVDNSLKALHTDYLDVLLIHRPDYLMHADEMAEAFTTLKQAGKVLHFGVSNFLPSQVALLASRLDFPLVTNQIELSVMHLTPFTDGTLDQCQQLQMAPMAWSPLGGGELFRGKSAKAERLRQALSTIAQQHEHASIDQVALAWLLTHPANILPILGTQSIDRLQSAVAAFNLKLTREQWYSIWVASTGIEVP